MRRRVKRRPRRGYILVMALLLIALAGLLLAGIARHSLLLAEAVVQQEAEFDARWGALSVQQAVLEHADQMLAASSPEDSSTDASGADKAPAPLPRLAGEVRLGEITYRFVLSDEEGKVNLNTVLRLHDVEGVRRTVEEFANMPPPVLIRALDQELSKTPLKSWGQVFAVGELPTTETPSRLQAATTEITCWGSGRLNIKTATPRALEKVCRSAQVTPQHARRLVDGLREQPTAKLATLLAQSQLTERERTRLEPLLTERSTCYALWLTSEYHGRQTTELRVIERGLGGTAKLSHFGW